jgi:3-oxoacyl-[acyl-carrier protein] reductase
MMISLKGKAALITGASRGIGAATAVMFARSGSDVLVSYRDDSEAAESVASRCRAFDVEALPFQANIADRGQVEMMFAAAVAEFGHLDIVVNNAGIWKYAAIEKMTEQELLETMDINLKGVFHCCTVAAAQMIKQQSGVIINIASTAGQRGEPYHSHYAATKAGVIGLTKSLAPELAAHNIRVNCVAPGWVATDMTRESLAGLENVDILSKIPLGRVATPEELAGPIVFMASDLATFITGEVLNVNGGAVLCG